MPICLLSELISNLWGSSAISYKLQSKLGKKEEGFIFSIKKKKCSLINYIDRIEKDLQYNCEKFIRYIYRKIQP